MNQTALKELRESKIVKILADGKVVEEFELTPNGENRTEAREPRKGPYEVRFYNTKIPQIITLMEHRAKNVYDGTLEVSDHKSYSLNQTSH